MDRSSKVDLRNMPPSPYGPCTTPLPLTPSNNIALGVGADSGAGSMNDPPVSIEIEPAVGQIRLVFENMGVAIYSFYTFCMTLESIVVLITTGASVFFYLWYDHSTVAG